MQGKYIFSVCLAMGMLVGCAPATKPAPNALQIQSFQTKEFEASKTVVFGSVLSVFQDLGYIVQSADKDTGFITAASPSSNKTGFWQAMAGVTSSGQTKATAFVEDIRPGFVRVRLNFVNSMNNSGHYGQNQSLDTPILEPKAYQTAFEKIDDAVFVRKGTISSAGNE
ncbi:hypothetical protein ACFWZU_00060 [Frateuria sp. GZRR33]|uniref:hypothetical protein n=1 Tax=Frateuria sp. GZRR33 TaxID=3351535 RepID=UPI003EDCA881